jgi:hypothetical protein
MGSPQPQFEPTHCTVSPVFFSIAAFNELAYEPKDVLNGQQMIVIRMVTFPSLRSNCLPQNQA